MKVRGHRECQDCATRWSYYETASITCPDCGSLHSVGLDERTRHTDAAVEYDLTPVRGQLDETATDAVADEAVSRSSEYVRKRGFVDAGELQPLDETFVAATVLKHVGAEFSRELRRTEEEELYFLAVLEGADGGERPPVEKLPRSFRSAFGLAIAEAVGDYQRDVRAALEDESHPEASGLAGRIRDHRKRLEALDGDVDPEDANRLVRATRDLGKFLITGEESALVTADNWLSGIE